MSPSAEDRIAIAELIGRYNVAFDTYDVEGWVHTFLPSGVFDGLYGSFSGPRELADFLHWHWTNPAVKWVPGSQHWITNLIIEGTDDHATTYCYGTVVMPGGGPSSAGGPWHYRDDVRKVNGEWKFAKRFVRAFAPNPPSSLSQ
jgi:hypothetical protein